MKMLPTISRIDQVAATLRQDLARGLWQGYLPGSRSLCRLYGVSPITMTGALKRLLKEKLLIPGGQRRPFKIADMPGQGATWTPKPAKNIVFLTEDPLHELPHHVLEVLYQLRLKNPHWNLNHRVLSFRDAKRPRKRWDQEIGGEEPDHLIAYFGSPAIAEWALNRSLPIAFFSGDRGGHPLPSVGFTPMEPLICSLHELIAQGHTKICLPMFGYPRVLIAWQRKTMKRVLEEHGIPFVPALHAPASPLNSPDSVINFLSRIWRNPQPTALVFMDWNVFTTAHCFLRELGLRIPADVSVILMTREPGMEWFRPVLTHFDTPCQRIVRVLSGWVDQGPATPNQMVKIVPRLRPGESIGPPPR